MDRELLSAVHILRYVVFASGVLLGASLLFEHKLRRKARLWIKLISFSLLALLILGEPSVLSWLQYRAWASSELSKALLPPKTPISYFEQYVFTYFILWRLLGVAVAFFVFILTERLVIKPSNGFRINKKEAGLISFGIALAGWPNLLIYITTFLALYAAMLAFITYARPSFGSRLPVTLPATIGLFVLPFGNQIISLLGLGVLRVTGASV